MKNKILIIKKNRYDVFFDNLNNIDSYYRVPMNNLFLIFCRKLNLSIQSIMYGKWKKELMNFDIVILFDNGYNSKISKYIKKRNKDIKIIFWYWNSIKEYGGKLVDTSYIDEVWTYNRFDAEKYNLLYNPQFYMKKDISIKEKSNVDVLFLGRDKGRLNYLKKLEIELNSLNITTQFIIITNSQNSIKYDDYLSLLIQSKCILDYSFVLPCGLSLRPLEALFYEKKLITNNNDIKNYDFYDPNNIFILGVDDINKIDDFINKPYKKIEKKVVETYSFNSWIKRFGGK